MLVRPAPQPNDLLLLDLDGSLIDIAPRPEAVIVAEDLKETLGALIRRDAYGLVIVTGRALGDADRMLQPLTLPMMASHGAEARLPGAAPSGRPLEPIGLLKPVIETLFCPFDGLIVEWKPFSAALHIRGAPQHAPAVETLLDGFVRSFPHYRIQRGRQVYEILPTKVSKANAVRALLQTPAYAGRRTIYVGDDAADEAAMRVVESCGGQALRVAGEHFASATAEFASPGDVRAWLFKRAAQMLEPSP